MKSRSACRSIATARPSRRGLKARKKLRGRTSLTSHGNRLPRGLRGQHSLRGRKGFDPHHAMQFIQGQDWLGLNNYIEDALLQAGFGRVNAARMSTSWVGDWSGAQWPASSFIGQLQQVSDIIGRGPESYRPGMGLYKRLARRKAHARSIVTTRPKKCCKSLGGLPTLARNLNRIASKGWAITDNAGLQVYTKSGWQPRALVQHKSLDNAYLFRTQRDAEAFCALHTLNGFADRI